MNTVDCDNRLTKNVRHVIHVASHLLKDDSLGVGGAAEGVGLPAGPQVSLLVVEIGPHLTQKRRAIEAMIYVQPGEFSLLNWGKWRQKKTKSKGEQI